MTCDLTFNKVIISKGSLYGLSLVKKSFTSVYVTNNTISTSRDSICYLLLCNNKRTEDIVLLNTENASCNLLRDSIVYLLQLENTF